MRVTVTPRLAALAVRELPIGAADCDIEDQEKVLVERRINVLLVDPRVVTILPATLLPEALSGGVDVEHDLIR